MDNQGGHGRRRSCCQQKSSLNDNHNEPPTHCQLSSSLLTVSLSALCLMISCSFLHCLLACVHPDVIFSVLRALGRLLGLSHNSVGAECTILALSLSACLCWLPFLFSAHSMVVLQNNNGGKKSVNAKGQWRMYWKYVHGKFLVKKSSICDLI